MKERFGQPNNPSIQVTPQPEVDDAVREVQDMYSYFDELGKLVEKHLFQLKIINETEQELALFFQQRGYQEKDEAISTMSIDIGQSFSVGVKNRAALIAEADVFNEFVKTFKDKAIQDSIDTMTRQEVSRVEFDSFAGKLEYLQRTPSNLTVMGKEHATSDPHILSLADKEIEHARNQFTLAKQKYQNLSTATIDKAVLLNMKREVDFRGMLERLVKVKGVIDGRGMGGLSGTGSVVGSGGGAGGGEDDEQMMMGAGVKLGMGSELYGGSGSPFEGGYQW